MVRGLQRKGSMRRREFIKAIAGSAVVWPLAARAQQPAMPVIGFLHAASAVPITPQLEGLRRGLAESGYVEEQNWRSSTGGRMATLIACQHSQPSLSSAT